MELITNKNVTVDKLQKLKRSRSLFHLATKKGIVGVKLSHLSGDKYMVHSAPHSSYYITMYRDNRSYLKGTCEVLVDFIKAGKYTIITNKE